MISIFTEQDLLAIADNEYAKLPDRYQNCELKAVYLELYKLYNWSDLNLRILFRDLNSYNLNLQLPEDNEFYSELEVEVRELEPIGRSTQFLQKIFVTNLWLHGNRKSEQRYFTSTHSNITNMVNHLRTVIIPLRIAEITQFPDIMYQYPY